MERELEERIRFTEDYLTRNKEITEISRFYLTRELDFYKYTLKKVEENEWRD